MDLMDILSVGGILVALGGLIWMLKNNSKRLDRVEGRQDEQDKRLNGHDITFEALRVDLAYMKDGIDSLRHGQEEMRKEPKGD